MPEKELSVEIREVDCIEVDDVNFAKPGEGEVLEELASDATSSNHEHARLPSEISDCELIEPPCKSLATSPSQMAPPRDRSYLLHSGVQ